MSITGQEINSAEGKAAPAGDASDSGRVAHSHTNAGVTPAPRLPIGLTKREYIAAMALQGIIASPQGYNDATYQGAARDAVAHADALLAALVLPPTAIPGDDDV